MCYFIAVLPCELLVFYESFGDATMGSFVKHVMLYHVVPIVCMNRFSIMINSVVQYVNLLKTAAHVYSNFH